MIFIYYDRELFREVAEVIAFELHKQIGVTCVFVHMISDELIDKYFDDTKSVFIMLGMNLYHLIRIPTNTIIFQMEQLNVNEYLTSHYLFLLHKAKIVWDYSFENIRILEEHGISAHYYGMGFSEYYTSNMDVDTKRSDRGIFIGSMNTRRADILKKFPNVDIHNYTLWGKARDNVVDKCAFAVNIHAYDPAILETTRLSYLLSRGIPVFSEPSCDKKLDCIFDKYVYFINFEDESKLEFRESRQDFSDTHFILNDDVIGINLIRAAGSDVLIDFPIGNVSVSTEFDVIEKIESDAIFRIPRPEYIPITIITLTCRNRHELFPIVLKSFRSQIYDMSKIEWIIIDDNNSILKYPISARYIQTDMSSIDDKRNLGVSLATNDIIMFMDDDDYYPPESVINRLKILQKFSRRGIECIGCTEYLAYDIIRNNGFIMKTKLLAESSMAFKKDFWIHGPGFVNGTLGEGYLFTKCRSDKIVSVPWNFVLIALTHDRNITENLRSTRTFQMTDAQLICALKASEHLSKSTLRFFAQITRKLLHYNDKW